MNKNPSNLKVLPRLRQALFVRKCRGDRMRAKLKEIKEEMATAQAAASLRTREMATAGRGRLL